MRGVLNGMMWYIPNCKDNFPAGMAVPCVQWFLLSEICTLDLPAEELTEINWNCSNCTNNNDNGAGEDSCGGTARYFPVHVRVALTNKYQTIFHVFTHLLYSSRLCDGAKRMLVVMSPSCFLSAWQKKSAPSCRIVCQVKLVSRITKTSGLVICCE